MTPEEFARRYVYTVNSGRGDTRYVLVVLGKKKDYRILTCEKADHEIYQDLVVNAIEEWSKLHESRRSSHPAAGRSRRT